MTRYRCIAADPPWPEKGGGKIKRGADRHYPVIERRDDIVVVMAGAMESRVDPDGAHLWMWTTDNYLKWALYIGDELGFRYIRTMCWMKPGIGLGQYLRGKHELCLLFVSGKLPPQSRSQPSCFFAAKGRHSEKPARAYEIIEAVSPGPRLEMFARQARPGWDVWGNEAPSQPDHPGELPEGE